MSKDFTPEELHIADKALGIRKSKLRIIDMDGKEIKFAGDEYKETFPNLSFLAGEVISELINKYGEDNPVLLQTEEILSMIIEAHDNNIPCGMHGKSQTEKERKGIIEKWYLGKLDPYFHYRETNDILFKEYVSNWVMEEQDETEKYETFYVEFKIVGRYNVKVTAKKGDIEDAKREALDKYYDADFGELEEIDGEAIMVENEQGDYLWER